MGNFIKAVAVGRKEGYWEAEVEIEINIDINDYEVNIVSLVVHYNFILERKVYGYNDIVDDVDMAGVEIKVVENVAGNYFAFEV